MSDDVSSSCELESLPSELIVRIFSFVPINQIIHKAGHLSKTLHGLCNSRELWRSVELSNVQLPLHIFQRIILNRPIDLIFKNVEFNIIPASLWADLIETVGPKLRTFVLTQCQNVNQNQILFDILSHAGKSLKTIKLYSSNSVENHIDFRVKNGHITSLRQLNLKKIKLSQTGFLYISELIRHNRKLYSVDFEGTYPIKSIAQDLVESITHVNCLKYLNLNNCTSVPEDQLKSCLKKHTATIEKLQLRNIQITNNLLPYILSLHKLTKLDLSQVQSVNDEFLQRLGQVGVNLRKLKINGCSVSSAGIRDIASVPLTHLFIAETHIDKYTLPLLVKQCQSLEVLDISHNYIENMVENFAKFLSQMNLLRRVVLYGYESLVIELTKSAKIEAIY